MNLITVRDLRARSGKVWKDLYEKGDLVLTNNGRPVAILSSADESNVEVRLRNLSRLRAMEAVERIQRRSIEKGLDQTSPEVINRVIRRARRGSGR